MKLEHILIESIYTAKQLLHCSTKKKSFKVAVGISPNKKHIFQMDLKKSVTKCRNIMQV